MRRNRILFFVTIFTLTLALGAMAQMRGRMGGQGARGAGQQTMGQGQFGGQQYLVRYLELTEEQITQWQAIRDDARKQAAGLIETRQANGAEIRKALESGSPNAATVGQLVIDNHGLGTQLRVIHEAAQAQFAAILDPDQRDKFEKYLELKKSMPRRGRGGQGFGSGAGMGSGGFGPGDGTCPWSED